MSTESKWTPEPWSSNDAAYHYSQSDDKSFYCTVRAGDISIQCEGRTGNEAKANAARIAACVNACTGMANPSAEIAALRAELVHLKGSNGPYADLAVMAGELAEALKECLPMLLDTHDVAVKARAAITKYESRSK